MPSLRRLYLRFREPKVFLVALCTFVVTSLLLHFWIGYDADWGGTNLTLSIEASIASAVLMMVAEESAALQREMAELQRRQLEALVNMAEAQRDMLADHTMLLRSIRDADKQLLMALAGKEE